MTKPFFFAIAFFWVFLVFLALTAVPLRADSLRALADLEYTSSKSSAMNKETGITSNIDRSLFSPLYSLDFAKEIFPTIVLTGGGMFDLESTDTELDGAKTESRNRNIRPYAELQLATQLLQAGAGYRKGELKQSATNINTSRRFTEEYNAIMNWKPVDLPRVGMTFTRNLAHDQPLTTDSTADIFELRSKYDYKDFIFDYTHTTNDTLQKLGGFKTVAKWNNGAVRYNHVFLGNKVSVSAGVRLRQDKTEFSGTGERLVDTSSPGASFYNLDDPPPATSNSAGDFTSGSLNNVDLLGSATQLSLGLDFGTAITVDTLYLNLIQPSTDNNQASPGEIDTVDHLFSWTVFISDDQEIWTNTAITRKSFNLFENRFELSFAAAEARYIKIVVTPLSQSLLPGKDIRVSQIVAKTTLPPETSKFTQTNLNSDLAANWRMSEASSSGYDFHYREDKSEPTNDKKSYLSMGANLRHIFNKVFSGNTRLTRSQIRQQGQLANTNHTYSASLAGKYLDTFNQTLTYSFTHNKDEEEGGGTSNSLVLRNNMDLYKGWSMNLDNGYSWQKPAVGGKITRIFMRLGSSISPNRWMHMALTYGVSWNTQTDEPDNRDRNGTFDVTWVPFPSLSMSADLSFGDIQGKTDDSTARQAYSINWSPFRDGTLQFSIVYGAFKNTDEEKTNNLSPAVKWQLNRSSLLTVEYSIGDSEDRSETVDFENVTVALRVF